MPDGKLISFDNSIYQSNLLRLLTTTDYSNLSSMILDVNNIAQNTQNKLETLFITGAKQIPKPQYEHTISINIGFKPSIVLIYSSLNVNYGADSSTDMYTVPTILSEINFITDTMQSTNSEITNNGFSTDFQKGNAGWSNITYLFYIAFRSIA